MSRWRDRGVAGILLAMCAAGCGDATGPVPLGWSAPRIYPNHREVDLGWTWDGPVTVPWLDARFPGWRD